MSYQKEILKYQEKLKPSFEKTGKTQAVIYVDGSYNSKIPIYGGGLVFITHNDYFESQAFGNDENYIEMQSVAGELVIASQALEFCDFMDISKALICYDNKGIECWCTGEWQANKFGTKKYIELYKTTISKTQIFFKKIKAHSGESPLNDRVDFLAKQAVGLRK